jgi:FMN reductase
MSETRLRVLAVIGTLRADSVTGAVIEHVSKLLEVAGCDVDIYDCRRENLPLFNPDSSRSLPGYEPLRARVEEADVLLLGTPDYHGSISSVLKNFLDHFWHEFAGKLFVSVVASHEKGLTTTDQLRTIARQCNAWCLPYGASAVDYADVRNGQIINDKLVRRLAMLARDTRVYGVLLAEQRRRDLDCEDTCFLARQRKATAASAA